MPSSDTNNLHQSSPSASRHEIKVSAKARPLFVVCENREERLHAYQNSHSQGFNLFVEGIVLLAWDIAWLSRSQGFTSETNDWEGICNMGKNLHQLIVANPQAPSQAKLQTDHVKRRRIAERKFRLDSGKTQMYLQQSRIYGPRKTT